MRFFYGDRPALLLALLAALTGGLLSRDYGVAWDEPAMREIGMSNYYYVTGGSYSDLPYEKLVEKDYGVGLELPLVMIEDALGITSWRGIFIFRHWICNLLFILGGLCFYFWVKRALGNRWWALIAYAIWLLSPLHFAHSFINSKDIPFMSMWAVCLFALSVAMDKNHWSRYLLAGAAIGYLLNLRIMGVYLILLALLLILLELISKREARLQRLSGLLLLCSSAFVVMWATWPFMWPDPIGNFLQAFSRLSHFGWNEPVLYLGQSYPATQLPWHYPLVHFALTVPLLVLQAGLGGILLAAWRWLQMPLRFFVQAGTRDLALAVVGSLGPVLAVIVLHSHTYDGWRHLFFIWPGFLLLAVWAMQQLWERLALQRKMQYALAGLLSLQFLLVFIFLIRSHPNQQLYFNEFIPRGDQYIRSHFEYDYWGTSFRQGVEYILENDDRPFITYAGNITPSSWVQYMLKPEQLARCKIILDVHEADYYLSTMRASSPHPFPVEKAWKRFSIQGSDFLVIWKKE